MKPEGHLLRQTPPRKAWLIGHRGAMGHAPENTLASFRLGREMGADLVECDVHISKDGKCVVMHDENVERTTDGHGLIRDISSSEIAKLDAGSWFSKKFKYEKVPLLDDLLLWAKKTRSRQELPMGVVIEIKNEPIRYKDIEKKVIRTVLKADMRERVVLISFDHGVVKRAKAIAPKFLTGMLFRDPIEDIFERARQIGADSLFPRRHLVTKSFVAKAHEMRLIFATWTVNETGEMKRILSSGADAIATNFPDRLNKILK
jgi:glycerophosphoryl diester phosphodiesterase